MTIRYLPAALFLFVTSLAFGQQSFTVDRTLPWKAQAERFTSLSGDVAERWSFEGCEFLTANPLVPVFSERFPVAGRAREVVIESVSAQYEKHGAAGPLAELGNDIVVTATIEQQRERFFVRLQVVPLRRSGSGVERATSFSVRLRVVPAPAASGGVVDRGGPFTYTSALNSGSLYKFGVENSGVYKLDYAYLKNELGISNLDNLDPKSIRLYGNGGAMLNERTDALRPDDLVENAIFVSGEADGKFDQGDYILFYAVGPRPWTHRPHATDPELTIRQHLYDRNAWYFIKIDAGAGLRIAEQPSIDHTNFTTTEFDDVQRLEDEKVNLLDFYVSAQGAGKRWFGDYFYQTRERTYNFEFPNVVAGSTARLRAEFAGRSRASSSVRVLVAGATLTKSIGSASVDNTEAPFAVNATVVGTFQPTESSFEVKVVYPEVSQQSEGWLDYIELNVRRQLRMSGDFLEFRDLKSLTESVTRFQLSGVTGGSLQVWDLTNVLTPRRQAFSQSGDIVEFGAHTLDSLRNFVAFYDNAAFPKPEAKIGAVANQNLHGLENLHMAIIYPAEFEAQAKQLADHRKAVGNLDIAVVPVAQIYNEFSSGAKDPTAIRDFARMLYQRNPDKFEYLLLFGDGSFDPRNNTGGTDNLDLIPVFETAESFSPIYSYPSDDYFALVSDNEGGSLTGALDLAVGRITARYPNEAQAVVDKIIDYDSSPATLGDWHLRNTFIADDGDGNVHLGQADKLANIVKNTEPWFNVEKIYFDAYQQVSTSGGTRFPDAEAAINADVFKGELVMNYIGHGGPRGWAQERVVDNNDIANWDNPNRYPLIITATCSFGGYDDYSTLTGGEQALLKVKSGAIALFTTVRAVYIEANNKLTDAVQSVIFERVNGRYRTIGEILRDGKNTSAIQSDNARRFTLLGDPSMYLALPEYRVATTRINDHDVTAGLPDTLRALMPVKLEGIVTDTTGALLADFNGKLYVTIFDKAQNLQTLGQDDGSIVRSFTVQRNIIFKGSATVQGGKFVVNFIVPKDINYNFGNGKISYYAENGTPLDAAGGDGNIIVGGNANAIQDDQPPLVQVFLNTDAFVFGGLTDANPKILVKCSDDYGMNVTGASLGHDLTAVIDGNAQALIVLNEFYETEQDNFRRGQALYPLRNLAPGRHTIAVKGWDIANNPGEGRTEFIVAESGQAALEHVLNYPNPFTTQTYFQFEHNLAGQQLDVQISIFSVAGKLVKTILHHAAAEGFRVNDIAWNGLDEYGDRLGRGVYLYRVKVRGTDVAGTQVTAESEFEKLVILK
jgi:hypothetical protein